MAEIIFTMQHFVINKHILKEFLHRMFLNFYY